MKKRTTPKHEFPNGLQVLMAIGNGFAVNSPDGRSVRKLAGKLLILNESGDEVAALKQSHVVGIIKSPAPQAA